MPLLLWVVRFAGVITRALGALLRMFKATRFGQWIWFYLFFYLSGLIGKILWLLGITLVANQFATPYFTGIIAGQMLGMPAEWVSFVGLLKLDQAITVMLSAVAIRMLDQVKIQRRRDAWQAPL